LHAHLNILGAGWDLNPRGYGDITQSPSFFCSDHEHLMAGILSWSVKGFSVFHFVIAFLYGARIQSIFLAKVRAHNLITHEVVSF
jgi:hypothetical protein